MRERRPYDSPVWRTIRAEVLARDAFTCRDCGAKADRVDHVQPWRQGGAWYAMSNLEAVCRSCNTKRAYLTGGRQGRRSTAAPPSRDW